MRSLNKARTSSASDIRDNIARAMRFVDGFDLDAFLADDKTLLASVHYRDTDIRHLGRNENAIA
jgi:hypothetical protein